MNRTIVVLPFTSANELVITEPSVLSRCLASTLDSVANKGLLSKMLTARMTFPGDQGPAIRANEMGRSTSLNFGKANTSHALPVEANTDGLLYFQSPILNSSAKAVPANIKTNMAVSNVFFILHPSSLNNYMLHLILLIEFRRNQNHATKSTAVIIMAIIILNSP